MKSFDVLIIGGSAAGMVAAISGKTTWPDKNFILIKKHEKRYTRNTKKERI